MRLSAFVAEVKRLATGFQRYLNSDEEMRLTEQDFEEWKELFDTYITENEEDDDGWG